MPPFLLHRYPPRYLHFPPAHEATWCSFFLPSPGEAAATGERNVLCAAAWPVPYSWSRRTKSAGCAAYARQSSFCTAKQAWGVQGAFNSPHSVGIPVIGLWLLNLTVAVCLKAVNTTISNLQVRKPSHSATKWPCQDRTRCWSLVVKSRAESGSPETLFNRPCCHHHTEVLQHKSLFTGAALNSDTFFSFRSLYLSSKCRSPLIFPSEGTLRRFSLSAEAQSPHLKEILGTQQAAHRLLSCWLPGFHELLHQPPCKSSKTAPVGVLKLEPVSEASQGCLENSESTTASTLKVSEQKGSC